MVGLAAVPIITELKLQPEQFGWLGSSFFALFSTSAIVVGFIVNTIATRWALLVLASVWALAQFPMVGSVGLTTLIICRVVLGAGGPIHVVCPPMLGEFTPVSQRGAVIAIYGAISTVAGILAPRVMGDVIQDSGGMLQGYMIGFSINAVGLIVPGLFGLLLWPNAERARLTGQVAQPELAPST